MTGSGFTADSEQIRRHAANLEALRARFDAVRSASAHIAQDSQAYGLLCGWIAAVLEGRHTRQDELIAYVEENLTLAAGALGEVADDYHSVDSTYAETLDGIVRQDR